MESADVVGTLARTELFQGLSPRVVEGVASIAEVWEIPAGQHVFFEGDVATQFFVVASGSVRIYIPAHGEELDLAIIEPGRMFGEGAILDGGPRLASALALEPTSLLVISRSTWLAHLEVDRDLARRVFLVLAASFRKYVTHAVEFLFLDVEVPDTLPDDI